MESQRGAQAHPMMMQSGGSMANSGMKKKSMPPAKKKSWSTNISKKIK